MLRTRGVAERSDSRPFRAAGIETVHPVCDLRGDGPATPRPTDRSVRGLPDASSKVPGFSLAKRVDRAAAGVRVGSVVGGQVAGCRRFVTKPSVRGQLFNWHGLTRTG